ncbi:hypothetical protein GVM20_08515 [Porphyrobacter sp. SLTP]|uniref:TorF family putative porin n=1 Tax=Porphyrobacter sp. SLTP TaxID=2683266 RepID=UPI001412D55B|nr:TorF family putative porin [Porphyrobacter sp. SLTP]NBB25164.1 hypothetical protein [Porphyrobacter sp. SLTP]
MRFLPIALLATIAAVPAHAQQTEEEPGEAADTITVSGSAGLTTDYRFRGVSQTDGELAVQGGITATHTSGVYVGAWGSNLAGWGTFGGANMELDLYAGVKVPVGAGTLDTGLVWYMYPGGADETDFAELYAKLSGTVGPLALTAGVAYAPQQEALGNVFFTGAAALAGLPDDPGDKEDNLYLSADAVYALGGTPVSLKAHLGYSDGNPGLGPNATSVAPTGTYFDWSLGADITPLEGLTFSIAYVDTDISRAESAYLQPSFSRGQDGVGAIAGSTVVAAVTASF